MNATKFILFGFFLLPLTVSTPFSYESQKIWFKTNPQCGYLRQSPIALSHQQASPLFTRPISLYNFDKPFLKPIKIINNGNTIEFDIEKNVNGHSPFIFGGPLGGIYDVETMHFHWGSPINKGSEHEINGIKYDLEMHIVCKNIKYPTIESARDDPLGLTVLAILFKEYPLDISQKPGLTALLNTLPLLLKYSSNSISKLPLTMTSIVGELNTKKFFAYQGSLTTPPCSQAVTWIVFEDAVPISRTKLQLFWNLRDAYGLPMVNNFRPIQPRNNRSVFYRSGSYT